MKIIYACRITVFFLFFFCVSAIAHDDADSHKVFKGIGDGFRALMSKNEYGGSVFTITINLDVTVTNESLKNEVVHLVTKIGTGFIVRDDGFLLTNDHVVNVNEYKENTIKKIHAQYATLQPPQRVSLKFKESYKAVDSNDVTFLISEVPIKSNPDSIDATLFRFVKEPNPSRKSFIFGDENDSQFSLVAMLGSPLTIKK